MRTYEISKILRNNNKFYFQSHFNCKWMNHTKYLFHVTRLCISWLFYEKLIIRANNRKLWAFINYNVSYYIKQFSQLHFKKKYREKRHAIRLPTCTTLGKGMNAQWLLVNMTRRSSRRIKTPRSRVNRFTVEISKRILRNK